MEVRARVDVVRDAGCENGQDRCGPLPSNILPGEHPVFSALYEPPQFSFTTVVRELDVSVLEEKDQAMPLPVQVAESTTQGGLGRDERTLLVDEGADVVQNGSAVFQSTQTSLAGGVSRELGGAFDLEERPDLSQGLERDRIAGSRRLYEASPAMRLISSSG